ncbi:MAG TPA: DNA methyltransferase [Xanthobacteraceae bacterium]|nr:DNA methyltransferase [Xanthobacteraceae bacterium]
MTDAYRTFLQAKIKLAESAGFEIDPAELNPALKPHIQVATQWALAGGRRLLASRFGTQKTTWHLEIGRLTMRHTGEPHLVVMPLGARLSFYNDAERFTGEHAIKLNWVTRDADIDRRAINLTNVERVREGNIDPRRFGSTTFDEGDILRNMSTKTFWTFTERAKQVRYRHVATATPDPREYAELLAFAGYLDIMDIGQARTRFFRRNSEKADKLTIHPHKEAEFWLWVASWALFINKPSDVDPSFSDDGYVLPPLDVRWHEVPTDHSDAGEDPNGQKRLIKDSAAGVQGAAAEKRKSLPARIAKMMELRAELPEAHRLIWHDLEDERRAIEKAAPEVVTVYGSQEVDDREAAMMKFQAGETRELAGKPVMIGSGPNLQHHCWWSIYLGVGWKFKDFIQSVHRTHRYGQAFEGFPADRPRAVRIDIIHTEAEREIVRTLQANWRRYEEQSARMSGLIREYGLTQLAIGSALTRTMEVARAEVKGERFTAVNNDCIDEVGRMAQDSVDLIVSSLPFSTQYEYTPSYRDFGHTDDDDHFFRQMDFLTPQLLRVLKPGRVCAIHVKDRIVEGSRSGLGFQTVEPFGAKTMLHFREHGFAYLGTKTIVTDVVRENNQTYRLGYTEQCKDGSRMGFGLPEYLHLFRKPQTDRSRGYADVPVVKGKREFDETAQAWGREDGYSRSRWQLDAAGFTRSSGNRLLLPSELAAMQRGIYRRYKEHSLGEVYDFEHHVACAEALEAAGKLPVDYAIIPVHSWHPDVLTDVVRMRSLNTLQVARGMERHLCPLPLDIVDRVIRQCSMPGELVLDMFGGLGTVAYCAVLQKRRGFSIELSPAYHRDAVRHLQDAERQASAVTLFDLLEAESSTAQAAE